MVKFPLLLSIAFSLLTSILAEKSPLPSKAFGALRPKFYRNQPVDYSLDYSSPNSTYQDQTYALIRRQSKPRPIYCNGFKCCFDPNKFPLEFDECLWGFIGKEGHYVQNVLRDHGFVEGNNWIEGLFHLFKKDVSCTVATGCNHVVEIPDGNDDFETIVAFLGLTAGKRYMLYQTANYETLKTGMNHFQTTVLPDIVSTFKEVKRSLNSKAYNDVKDGLKIVTAVLGILAAPLPGGTAIGIALKSVSGLLGVTSGVSGLVARYRPVNTVDLANVVNYFDECRTVIRYFQENVIEDVLKDLKFAFRIMEENGGHKAWLSTRYIELWYKPTSYEQGFERLLTAWAISQVFSATKIFMHWEPREGGDFPSVPDYPGKGTLKWEDKFGRGNYVGSYYPVAFNLHGVGNVFTTAREIREYYPASKLRLYKNMDITWDDVVASSWMCHLHYKVDNFNVNGQLSLTDGQIHGDLNVSRLRELPLTAYPCLFSVPIADGGIPGRWNSIQDCKAEQKCCTGRSRNDYDDDASKSKFVVSYTIDNLGLDNWFASKLKNLNTFRYEYFSKQCSKPTRH